jgi:tRNA(fMet)-specific endonuclease VapC
MRSEPPLYLLDTDIASFVIKGRSPALDAKLAAVPPDHVAVSAITRAELIYGLQRLAPSHGLHRLVREFLLVVQVLPWGEDAADRYAEIRHRLTTAGRPIGEMDMMIAAHAVALGAVLVTNNARHFARLAPLLTMENWAEL